MRFIDLTTVALSVLTFVSQSVSALPVRDSYSELSSISKRGPRTGDGPKIGGEAFSIGGSYSAGEGAFSGESVPVAVAMGEGTVTGASFADGVLGVPVALPLQAFSGSIHDLTSSLPLTSEFGL